MNTRKWVVDAECGNGKYIPGSTGRKTAIGSHEKQPGLGLKGANAQESVETISIDITGAAASMRILGTLLLLEGVVAMVIAKQIKSVQILLSLERLEADLIDCAHVFSRSIPP